MPNIIKTILEWLHYEHNQDDAEEESNSPETHFVNSLSTEKYKTAHLYMNIYA